jgi:hypothetical protein
VIDREEEPAAPGAPKEAGPLRFVVEGEARRVLSEAQIQADPARLAAGWERRFIADGARCEEMVRLYEELGYEVAADPILPEHAGVDCEDCQLVIRLRFRMIYTRGRGRSG